MAFGCNQTFGVRGRRLLSPDCLRLHPQLCCTQVGDNDPWGAEKAHGWKSVKEQSLGLFSPRHYHRLADHEHQKACVCACTTPSPVPTGCCGNCLSTASSGRGVNERHSLQCGSLRALPGHPVEQGRHPSWFEWVRRDCAS